MPLPSRKPAPGPARSTEGNSLPRLNKEEEALFQSIKSLSLKALLEESIRAMNAEGAKFRTPLQILRLVDELRDVARLTLGKNPEATSLSAEQAARALSDDPDLLIILARALANNSSTDPAAAARIAKLLEKLQTSEKKLRRELFRHKAGLLRAVVKKSREDLPVPPKAPAAPAPQAPTGTTQPPDSPPFFESQPPPRNPLYEQLAAGLQALGEAVRKEQLEAKKAAAEEEERKNKEEKIYEELHRDCESLEDTHYAAYLHPQPLSDPPGPRMREHLRALAKKEKQRRIAAPSRLLEK